MNKEQISTEAFKQLIGNKLCAVTFIWDYYQLLIGLDGLSIYSHPRIRLGEKWIKHTEGSYRDALCERIGIEVVAVSDDDDGMLIEFKDETGIAISFLAADRIGDGPESLVASNHQGNLLVVGDSEPNA
jgi:hypothetical protein